jgi:hypothetical protein
MTELTIKDLNCSTCNKYRWGGCSTGMAYDSHIISSVGCASHPLALQVLAKPVVEELTLHKLALEENIDLKEIYDETERNEYRRRLQLINKTIKLLKGDAS